MIGFSCCQCGQCFSVGDKYAGKRTRCPICGQALTVPVGQPPAPPGQPAQASRQKSPVPQALVAEARQAERPPLTVGHVLARQQHLVQRKVLVEKVLSKINIQDLPMLPEAATTVMALVRDPSISVRALVEAMEPDTALVAGLLKLANSALYGCGRNITSVAQAVIRLGLRECQNVVLAVSQRRMFAAIPPSRQERCERLWHHALVTAYLCRQLNRQCELGFKGEEFACGLCHDLGRLLITLGAGDYCEIVDPLDFEESPARLSREQEILGTDHCTLGAWFGEINGLPVNVINAIQYHHNPTADTGLHVDPVLMHLIAAADHMANYLEREQKAEGYDLAANTSWAYLEAGRNTEHTERIGQLMTEALAEVEETISAYEMQAHQPARNRRR